MELHITGDPSADKLLSDDAFALLTGMLLDQQVTMESAFAGPEKIRTRIGSMDPAAIAGYDPQEFVEMFKERPAVHRRDAGSNPALGVQDTRRPALGGPSSCSSRAARLSTRMVTVKLFLASAACPIRTGRCG